MYFLPPNTKVIENLIENYESGRITLYYGNSSSGKTTCGFLASLCAKDHKVVYVDTEKGFSSERIKQLYDGDINKLLENIFLIQPKSFKEQHETILKLKKLCENDKIKLIIVDTIGNHYRTFKKNNLKEANSMLVEQMATLVRIARDLDKIVIVSNQVVANLENKNSFTTVGGKPVYNLCKDIIKLKRSDDDIRTAKLMKKKLESKNTSYYKLNKEIRFEIKEKGLFRI